MTTPALSLHNLNLKIPSVTKPILQEINYCIEAGDFVILLGSNGSGKSSLLKVIDRRYQLTAGEIRIAGKKAQNYSLAAFCRQVITITQNCLESLFPTLSVLENCVLAKSRVANNLFDFGISQAERQFFRKYLSHFNKNLSDKLDIKASTLSGGEQQALTLALSVLAKPQLLLLDEHTSALDPKAATHLMQITAKIIREQQITCIMCTHDLDIALQYGNRILVLQNGKVLRTIESGEKTAISRQELQRDCY